MTEIREPGTVEHELYRLIQDFPPHVLEDATGTSSAMLYRMSSPSNKARLPATMAARLDALLTRHGQPQKFLPLLKRIHDSALDGMGGPMPMGRGDLPDAAPLLTGLASYVKARESAMADGRIDTRDIRDLEAALSALDVLETKISAKRDRLWRVLTELRQSAKPRAVAEA